MSRPKKEKRELYISNKS